MSHKTTRSTLLHWLAFNLGFIGFDTTIHLTSKEILEHATSCRTDQHHHQQPCHDCFHLVSLSFTLWAPVRVMVIWLIMSILRSTEYTLVQHKYLLFRIFWKFFSKKKIFQNPGMYQSLPDCHSHRTRHPHPRVGLPPKGYYLGHYATVYVVYPRGCPLRVQ